MPRHPAPYRHRGWFVTNAGGRRHKLCREEEGKAAARRSLLSLLASLEDEERGRAENFKPAGPAVTVSELARLYTDHKEGKIAPHTLIQQRRWLGRFALLHGDRPAKSLTRLEAQGYLDGIAAGTFRDRAGVTKPYGPRTVNIVASALRCMYRWGADVDLVPDKNPFDRYRRLPSPGRQRLCTDEEFQALLRHSRPHFRRALLALRLTSLRPGELRGLKWDMVDWESGCFVMHVHKTMHSQRVPKPRVVPFPACVARLLRWLRARQGPGGPAFIFLNSRGRQFSRCCLSCYMVVARRRAGILPDSNGEHLSLYSFRHLYLTRAAASRNIDGVLLQRLAGHESLSMTSRYVHLAAKTLAGAAAEVAGSLRPKRSLEAEARKLAEASGPAEAAA